MPEILDAEQDEQGASIYFETFGVLVTSCGPLWFAGIYCRACDAFHGTQGFRTRAEAVDLAVQMVQAAAYTVN